MIRSPIVKTPAQMPAPGGLDHLLPSEYSLAKVLPPPKATATLAAALPPIGAPGAMRSRKCRVFAVVLAVLCLLSISRVVPPECRANITDGLKDYRRGDYGGAFRKFAPLAERGNVKAQYYIGYMYLKGEGIGTDYNKAFKWLSKAAAKGNSKALFHLGFMYYT